MLTSMNKKPPFCNVKLCAVEMLNAILGNDLKELLKDNGGQIKRANETSAEQQMKEMKKLIFKNHTSIKEKLTKTSTNSILS